MLANPVLKDNPMVQWNDDPIVAWNDAGIHRAGTSESEVLCNNRQHKYPPCPHMARITGISAPLLTVSAFVNAKS